MEKYKEMYYTLFNEVTTVIEALKAAQQNTEDIFLSNSLPLFGTENDD